MNSAGENPQSFRPDLRAKRKRSGPPTMDTAGPSFESYNSFSVLSDTDSETETAESGKPPSPKKGAYSPCSGVQLPTKPHKYLTQTQ